MVSIYKEEAELGINVEVASTWGTVPSGSALRIPVDSGEWMHDIVEEYRDETPRNVLARDFVAVPTVGHAEGSLSGPFYPITSPYFLAGILGSANTGVLLVTSGDYYVHEFTVARNPLSFGITQTTDGVSSATDQQFYGMMPTSYTLRWDASEGAVEWDSEFIGKGGAFLATTGKTFANSTLSGVAPRPMVGAQALVAIDSTPVVNVLDFEITISREVELAWSAGGDGIALGRRPTIRRCSPPRITFTATCELQGVADIQKYSKAFATNADSQANDTKMLDQNTDTDFGTTANIDTWWIRIATPRDMNFNSTPIATSGTVTTGTSTLDDKLKATGYNTADDAVIDIYLDEVQYAESPIIVDRSDQSATFQFSGVAMWDEAAARLGIFRVFNQKGTEQYDLNTGITS